jgi:hypothetical protein
VYRLREILDAGVPGAEEVQSSSVGNKPETEATAPVGAERVEWALDLPANLMENDAGTGYRGGIRL